MESEKRLIDAVAGAKAFEAIAEATMYKGTLRWVVPVSEIDKLPTVDAVEVVRCEKCIHWDSHGNGYGQCRHLRFHIENEIDPTTTCYSFCDKGERMRRI